ncbi:MAG: PadR family transcriptional regulator [Dehalococcoidia bacterium]|nr:PadR family transcriptional regulator [Dehalococcoidia bacterium]
MYESSWEQRPFQKGDLKYVILGLVAEKPRHGYEIIRSLEERSHGFYAPSPGAVYPTLQFLEEAGYVTAAEHEGKKIYTVTEEGHRFLHEQKDFAEGIKKHMSDMWGAKGGGEARETMAELRRLGRLMRHHHWGRRSDPQKMARIREVISRACGEIEAIIEE